MHESSHRKMAEFVNAYLADADKATLEIVDLGANSVNGTSSYRPLFNLPNWHYRGLDVVAGTNVDIVVADPYRWTELEGSSIDVIVSGQTLEHIEFPWLTVAEISRVLRPGGLACLIAPAAGPEHRYPVDCWRIYPDGMRALARHAGLREVEIFTDWNEKRWKDTFAVLQKPHSMASEGDSPFPAMGNRRVAERASTAVVSKRRGLLSFMKKQ